MFLLFLRPFRGRSRAACAAAAGFWAAALLAQPAVQPGAAAQDPVFDVTTKLVVLHVSVVDKNDELVVDLTKDDFGVFEDDKPQAIREFRREDVPVSVGILIDNSGSMRDKRMKVNAAALDFVKASNPDDEAFIVNFNDEAYLDSDFTNDVARMQDALQRIDSRGGTALYDAIQMSLDHLNKKAKREKRVLLVLSDGEDNSSRVDLERVVRQLQEQERQTTIYAIGLLSDEEKGSAKRAERALRHISRATGGPAYFPGSVDEVQALVRRISTDIRNQYMVIYSPAEEKPPGFRRVRVELDGKAKRYQVRHRPGYFQQ